MKNGFSSASRGLVVAAAIVIIIAGMKQAAPLLVPFLLSVFIAVLSLPALNALEKRGLGQGLSLLLVMLAVLVIGALLAMLVGSSIDDFTAVGYPLPFVLQSVGIKQVYIKEGRHFLLYTFKSEFGKFGSLSFGQGRVTND